MHKDKERPKPPRLHQKGLTKPKINLALRQLLQFSIKRNRRVDSAEDASRGQFQLEVWEEAEQ